MPTQINITQEAQIQYEACIDYIRLLFHEENAAKKIEAAFLIFTENVSTFPEMYPLMLDQRLRDQGVRRALVENYVVLYQYEDEVVMVIGFFHQMQDYARFV